MGPGLRRDDAGDFERTSVIASVSEAIQGHACDSGLLRRVAPRNDGRDIDPPSRDGIRPSFASTLSLSHEEGAGKAGWPHAPGACAQKDCAKARRPQAQAVTTGLPCAMVLRLIGALPGEPAFATVAYAKPLELSARLSACIGRARTTRLRRPHLRRSSTGTSASTAFRSTFVTIAIRPSHRCGMRKLDHGF
jgi:hypothetical protein